MKTVGEYLKEGLTTEHYELIKKYKDSCRWDMHASDVVDALEKVTMWSCSQEGLQFWIEIHAKLMQGTYVKYSNNIFLKL